MEAKIDVRVKKLKLEAKLPTYAHPGDAGMDLYAAEATTISAHGRGVVSTGLAFAIPDGYVGLVWDKSGLALKAGITTMAGVLDAGYRGELQVVLHNTTDTDYTFAVGDKVAQLLVQPIVQGLIAEVSDLDDTSRGVGGFGSTGK